MEENPILASEFDIDEDSSFSTNHDPDTMSTGNYRITAGGIRVPLPDLRKY